MTLELNDISKKVAGITHIKSTSLLMEPGHFNVLLGETGAGKSSLIKLLAGLESPATGSIKINGKDVTGLSPQKRNVSLVHQFFVNYPHMTVFENIASPLKIVGMDKPEIDRRVGEAAEILQLTPMLSRRPQELSGGQQQRTALARAIVKESDVVFLDEPLANLDYKLREELRDQLPELFADRGSIVVYATSEPEEALLLGGKTALMNDGTVEQFGETSELYRNPASLQAAKIFSDPPINVARITKSGGNLSIGNDVSWAAIGAPSNLQDGIYDVAIRPNYISPEPNSVGDAVPVTGVIQITELSGSVSTAHFQFGEQSWVSVASGVHAFEIGEQHTFYMDPTHCFFFSADGAFACKGGAD